MPTPPINTISQLQNKPKEYGVELDLHPDGELIIIHHDPFTQGEDFEYFINKKQFEI